MLRLDVHAQLAARLDRRRARVLEARADDGQRHRPALVRRAVRRVEHDRRRVIDRLHELDDVVVRRRRFEVGGLGGGLQIGQDRILLRVAWHGEHRGDEGDESQLAGHDEFSLAANPTTMPE